MARILALVAVLTTFLVPSAHAAGPDATTSALGIHMRGAGSASGGLVVDLDSGAQLLSVRADTLRIPASVEKLFTTATALGRFGSEAVLTTEALARVQPDEFGVVAGDVYLRGGGDPTLGRERVDDLAGQLLAAGVSEITGNVVGDESAFDTRRGPNGWGVDGWVGPLSALVYGRGRVGRSWIKQPALGAARAFRSALSRAGIFVDGKARTGATPDDAQLVAQAASPPMRTLIRLANEPSDNFVAEMLVKAVGRRFAGDGSTAAGLGVARRFLRAMRVRPTLVDGSGLSRSNRTSPRQVITLLKEMADDEHFLGSLAVAGRTGTLDDRMRKSAARGRCFAKTGTIIGVSNLAGYCVSRSGARTAFAFLMNNVNIYGARRLQDRMAASLAKYAP
jgi:D-alanyl-D-alanine carboxypeptidase/D-alanyl-D-alanine-endopeptidase (penicillin-binding protein 4)